MKSLDDALARARQSGTIYHLPEDTMNHSPLPWHTEDANITSLGSNEVEARIAICNEQRQELARTSSIPTAQESRANAAYIVHAANTLPKLVELLEEAEAVIDGRIGDMLTGDQMAESGAYNLLNEIRALLAKEEAAND